MDSRKIALCVYSGIKVYLAMTLSSKTNKKSWIKIKSSYLKLEKLLFHYLFI